jgi:drug/metabolite transporter (DMT)-like permease
VTENADGGRLCPVCSGGRDALEFRRAVSGALAIGTVVVIWGFHYIVLFHPLRLVSPGQYLTLRFFWASLFLLALPPFYRLFKNIPPRSWVELCALGLFSIVWYQWSFLKAVALMDPLPLVMILSLGPILVGVVRLVRKEEAFLPVQWFGMIFVVLGTGFLLSRPWTNIAHLRFGGNGYTWAFMCLFLFVFQTLLVRRLVMTLSIGQVTFLPILIGGAGLSLWHPSELVLPPADRTAGVIIALLYSIFLALFLAYFLWNAAIRALGPTQASLWSNAQPLVTALGAYFILKEPLSLRQVGGGILMAVGFGLFFFPLLSNDPYRPVLKTETRDPKDDLSLEVDPDRKGEKEKGVGVG